MMHKSENMKEKEAETPHYIYDRLGNGLRLVCLSRKDAVVEHCGVAVLAGSRDETPEEEGLAHFVEHTIFKGTGRRRSWHILNRMELIGGELNAYTTKEETVIYSTFPAGHLGRAFDLIADLVSDSRFPDEQIDLERGVVMEEIDSYRDTPSEAIFDDFDEIIYAGSPLAHNILGSPATVEHFTSADCRRWLDRFYTPERMVVFYSGPLPEEEVIKLASRYFGGLYRESFGKREETPAVLPRFDIERDIDSNQAHTVMGARIGGVMSADRHSIALLTNIIGGPSMNSLLNVELRERHGWVYSVDASTSVLSDTGLLTIYFGCDKEHVERCRRKVERILESIAEKGFTQRRLEAAKKQYLGQLTVGSTASEATILSAARATLLVGRALTRKEIEDAVRGVTNEQLREAARKLEGMSRLTLR